jgi:hypothetical protein
MREASRASGRRSALPVILATLAVLASLAPGAPPPVLASREPTAEARADVAPAAGPPWRALDRPPIPGPRPAGDPRLDWRVAAVADAEGARGSAAALEHAKALGLTVDRGRVRLIVEASDPAAAKHAMRSHGVDVEASAGDLVQVLVSPGQLRRLGRDRGVVQVRPPLAHRVDAVTGQGTAVVRADAWHAAGITGTGVKVAVIDLGFKGLAAAGAAGDLPSSVTTVDMCSGHLATATEHGTAVAEIVHEIAPSATLYLICIDTEVELAQAVAFAQANGISVINHSVAWYNTSRGDGTGTPGTPDATAAHANAAGMLWVNAAGNEAETHWTGTFLDGGSGWHLFAPDNFGNGFYLGAGETGCAFLKWDDWPGSAQDYDLGLVTPGGTLVAGSTNAQTGTQEPTEAACYTNPGATTALYFVTIRRYDATASPRFDLYVTGTGGIQYASAAGSVTEPASSPATLAAGAVCWAGTTIEPFSSQGPTIDGRVKPDLAGPDRVSTTTYGPYASCASFAGFPGTSAAAPHVAGVAALVRSVNPAFGPDQVRAYLVANAADLGDLGTDPAFGAGLVRLSAVPPVALAAAPEPSLAGESVTLTATMTPPAATGTVTFRDVTDGGSTDLGSASLVGGVASLNTAFPATGVRQLVAAYSGDGTHPAATSVPLVHRVRAASLVPTTTTLALAPDPVATGSAVTLTATVTPVPAAGSIEWLVDGVVDGSTPVASDGTAVTARTYWSPGSHAIVARFVEGTLFDGSASTQQLLAVRQATSVQLDASAGTAIAGETLLRFTATLLDQDATGTMTFRDTTASGSSVLASVPLTRDAGLDMSATLAVRLAGTGSHTIVAEYGGDASYAPAASNAVVIGVTPDVGVSAAGVGVGYATFYPYRDGYRDTVSIRGTPGEAVSVAIRVYNGAGRLVRSWSLATRTSPWAVAWNGRTASGTLLAAGKYRIVQTVRDLPGHARSFTAYSTISTKRLSWFTGSITKYGSGYGGVAVSGLGRVSSSSRYIRGVTLYAGVYPGLARVRYDFTLLAATKYGTLTFKALGTPRAGRGVPYVSVWNYGSGRDDGVRWAGRSFAWYSTSVSSSGHVSGSRIVRGFVTAVGDNLGWYDLAKVQLTYRYALLR